MTPPSELLALAAMRFTVPLSMRERALAGRPSRDSHASMTLLLLPDGRPVGVTCHHVLTSWLARPGRVFAAGDAVLDPLGRLIAHDPLLDLAVLDLGGLDPLELSGGSGEAEFFEPTAWPLGGAEPGEPIGLGGYPGAYVQVSAASPVPIARDFKVGATRVMDVGRENIVCGLDRAHWIEGSGTLSLEALGDLGGLSGGPGLVRRGRELHLAGLTFVVARDRAYLRLRPARLIGPDGEIGRVHAS